MHVYTKLFNEIGGEDQTIQFMESVSIMDSSTPLLKDSYAYGVVKHPFPLNCFMKEWYLGPGFYHAVKIGIVQYVCLTFVNCLDFAPSPHPPTLPPLLERKIPDFLVDC